MKAFLRFDQLPGVGPVSEGQVNGGERADDDAAELALDYGERESMVSSPASLPPVPGDRHGADDDASGRPDRA
jgi:hypothetical protein